MTVAAHMIITRGGTNLPLDQRRRDALANYAELQADAEGVPKQTWVLRNWPLKDYEAKDLLKGNASEAVWERIVKGRGLHCGWRVVLPIMGAVIGVAFEDFIRAERAQLEREAQQREREARELASLEATLLRRPVVDVGSGSAPRNPRLSLADRSEAAPERREETRREVAGKDPPGMEI